MKRFAKIVIFPCGLGNRMPKQDFRLQAPKPAACENIFGKKNKFKKGRNTSRTPPATPDPLCHGRLPLAVPDPLCRGRRRSPQPSSPAAVVDARPLAVKPAAAIAVTRFAAAPTVTGARSAIVRGGGSGRRRRCWRCQISRSHRPPSRGS